MPVRRPTTFLATLTLVAATAVTGLTAGAAAAVEVPELSHPVQVSSVATAPCPVTKGEQRTAAARAEAKAAHAAAKRADADARAAAKRVVAAGSRKGGAQEQAARKAAQAAGDAARRAAKAAAHADALARKAAQSSQKATRARATPTCQDKPLTISSARVAPSTGTAVPDL